MKCGGRALHTVSSNDAVGLHGTACVHRYAIRTLPRACMIGLHMSTRAPGARRQGDNGEEGRGRGWTEVAGCDGAHLRILGLPGGKTLGGATSATDGLRTMSFNSVGTNIAFDRTGPDTPLTPAE